MTAVTTKQKIYPEYRDEEFSNWIRTCERLQSGDGWRFYNIDGIMWRTKSNKWIIIENKTCGSTFMKPHQQKTLEVLHRALSNDTTISFAGTYLITHQNFSPIDGWSKITKFDGNQWKTWEKELNAKDLESILANLTK